MQKTAARKPQKDRFSPPDWWRKWRPLRWLAGGGVLIALALWGRSMLDNGGAETEVAEAPAAEAPAPAPAEPAITEVVIAPEAPAAEAPAPEPAAAPEPAPAVPVAAPAPPRPAPKPVEVIEELPSHQVPDYQAYTKVETSTIELMTFRSYASVDKTFAALEKGGFSPQLTSNHRKVPEEFPPYDLDRIEVSEYKHLGQVGSLTVQFFNDRLFEVEFRPKSADAYIVGFRSQYPQIKRSKTGRSEWTGGQLRIASSLELAVSDVGKALRTKPYATWQDRRLVAQRDTWDARYAPELAR